MPTQSLSFWPVARKPATVREPLLARLLETASRLIILLALAIFLNVLVQAELISVRNFVLGAGWIGFVYCAARFVNVPLLIALCLGLMVTWSFASASVPHSDFAGFLFHSQHIANGELKSLISTKSFTTGAYFAVFIALFGDSAFAHYLASGVAWVAGALLIYLAARNTVKDAFIAKFILACLLLYPSHLIFSPVLSSECVFFLLSGLLAFSFSQVYRTKSAFAAAGIGLIVGLMFLTRGIAVVHLIFSVLLLVYILSTNRKSEFLSFALRRYKKLGYMLAGFLCVLMLHGTLSYSKSGIFTVNTSQWGAFNFLVGTNIEKKGRFNFEDMELAGYKGENRLPRSQAKKRALELAIGRITEAPKAFVAFTLTTKVAELWSQKDFLHWTIVKSEHARYIRKHYGALFANIQMGPLFLVLVLFCAFLARGIFASAVPVALISMVPIGLTLMHLLIEVRGRYHLPFIPFIIMGACLILMPQLRGLRPLSGRLT